MFESITSLLASLFDIDSSSDTSPSSTSWTDFTSSSDSSSHMDSLMDHTNSEPSFHNAFSCGPDHIVPSEASSAFPSFEYTEVTYGSSISTFDDWSSSTDDWDR